MVHVGRMLKFLIFLVRSCKLIEKKKNNNNNNNNNKRNKTKQNKGKKTVNIFFRQNSYLNENIYDVASHAVVLSGVVLPTILDRIVKREIKQKQ